MAGDFDERSLDPVRLGEFGVGFLKLAQQRVLLHDQLVMLDRLPHNGGKELGIARFGDVSEDVAPVDGLDDCVQIRIGREEQTRGLGADRHRLTQDLHAVHSLHPLVRKNDVNPGGPAQKLKRHRSVPEGVHLVIHPQQVLHGLKDVGLVVDDHENRLRLWPRCVRFAAERIGARPRAWFLERGSRSHASLLHRGGSEIRRVRHSGRDVPEIGSLFQRYLDSFALSEPFGLGLRASFREGGGEANRLISVTSFPRVLYCISSTIP